MDAESFRNIAQGIQAVVIAIAFVIGGVWALYRFLRLREVKSSEMTLQKTEGEIAKASAELAKLKNELHKVPHLQIQLLPRSVGSLDENNAAVVVNIKVTNVGNQSTWLIDGESRVLASEVQLDNGELQISKNLLCGKKFELLGTTISTELYPGESYEDEFIFPIFNHGIYSIDYEVYTSSNGKVDFDKNEEMENWGSSVFYQASSGHA